VRRHTRRGEGTQHNSTRKEENKTQQMTLPHRPEDDVKVRTKAVHLPREHRPECKLLLKLLQLTLSDGIAINRIDRNSRIHLAVWVDDIDGAINAER
jgi:hypothetical protein